MPPKQDIARDILRALRQILKRVSTHSRELSREAGLTIPQLLCMQTLESGLREGPVTAAMVARRVHLSSPTVTRLLDRLEKAGFVARTRDTGDRRKVHLDLTERGRTVLRRSPPLLQEEFLRRLRRLPAEERRTLLHSLDRIAELMGAAEVEAAPLLAPEHDLREVPSKE